MTGVATGAGGNAPASAVLLVNTLITATDNLFLKPLMSVFLRGIVSTAFLRGLS